jgi:hypothetical protein
MPKLMTSPCPEFDQMSFCWSELSLPSLVGPPLALVNADHEPEIRDMCPERIVDVLKFDVPVDYLASMGVSMSSGKTSNGSPLA